MKMENHLVLSCKQVTDKDGIVRFWVNTNKGASIQSETPILGGQVIQLRTKKAGDKYFNKTTGEEKTVTDDGWLFQGQVGGTEELKAIVANKALMAEMEL